MTCFSTYFNTLSELIYFNLLIFCFFFIFFFFAFISSYKYMTNRIKHLVLILFFIKTTTALAYDWSSESKNIALGNLGIIYNLKSENLIAINYIKPYGLSELAIKSISLSIKKSDIDCNITFSNNGDEIIYQNILAINAGRQLSEKLYLKATAVGLIENNILNKTRFILYPEISCHYLLSEKAEIGTRIVNPTGFMSKKNESLEDNSMSFYIGLKITPAKNLGLYYELEKNNSTDTKIKTGTSYLILNTLNLMAGISCTPFNYHFGSEIKLKKSLIVYSFTIHPVLGKTSSLSIKYNIWKIKCQ